MAKSWSTQSPSIQALSIQPARLTLRDLRHIARSPDLALTLDPGWEKPVEAAAATVADVVARGDAAYGINTGFGLLARKRIPNESLRELQDPAGALPRRRDGSAARTGHGTPDPHPQGRQSGARALRRSPCCDLTRCWLCESRCFAGVPEGFRRRFG